MSNRRYNLLFLITDQQRHDTLSCYGNTIVHTPNLDALARNGARFARCYTICPVCGPARSSMLTGMSPYVQETRTNESVNASTTPDGVCMTHKTYDEILVENGYYAEYHGKWHAPIYRASCYTGFETVMGKPGLRSAYGDRYHQWLNTVSPRIEAADGQLMDASYRRAYIPNPIDIRYGMKEGETPCDAAGEPLRMTQPDYHGELLIAPQHTKGAYCVDRAIEGLRRAHATGRPFTLTCSLNEPHSPMVLTRPYYGMFPPEKMPVPKSIDDTMENSPYRRANRRLEHPEYADPEKLRFMISEYYGMVKQIDDNLGRLLEELKSLGEYDNTLIVFTSDHGEMLGAHGMREKNVFYEESLHVPLIMTMPGVIPAGTVVQEPITTLSLHATILDYLQTGENLSDGVSLRGLIEGTAPVEQEPHVVCEWSYPYMPSLCVVTQEWKLIVSVRPEELCALYHISRDPEELCNLIGRHPNREAFRDVVEQLKHYLLDYLEPMRHPLLELIRDLEVIKH